MAKLLPIPTRFEEQEVADIDALIKQGEGKSRSEIVRNAVRFYIDKMERKRIGMQIAASYQSNPQTSLDNQLAVEDALALTDAETW